MARSTLLACMLIAASVGVARGGVKVGSTVQYPGKTGAFPAACENGVNESADGAPSPDIKLGDSRVASHVTGNQPEQIHITHADEGQSMYISWTTGNASYTFCGDGAQSGNVSEACFHNLPVAQKIGSVVEYGTSSKLNNAKRAESSGQAYQTEESYQQIYQQPGQGLNYTSPIIHHIKVTGLKRATKYYYRVGDGTTFSSIKSFKTLPAPGHKRETKIGILADVGTTEATYEVIEGLEANKPDIVFLAGDHTYADNHGNDQRYWDAWARLISNSTSTTPWQISLGNHEEETQLNDCLVNALATYGVNGTSCGTADFIRANCPGANCPCYSKKYSGEKGGFPPEFVHQYCPNKAAFVAATTRWAVPYEETGSSSPHFYSFKFGLVHAIVLSAYEPYCGGSLPCAVYQPGLKVLPSGNSAQYEWLAREVKKVDKTQTPWVIAFFHNPWYTSYGGFKTEDCGRQALEPLLQRANVDLLFAGHIHAYERSNPVFDFKTDPHARTCDPVHIVIGDAGNDETLNCPLIDRGLTNGKLNCAGGTIETGSTEGYYFSCVSHTFQDSPYFCQKNDDRVNTTGLGPSYYGCQEQGYCPNKQPITSAFRSSAYGSGLLTIVDETTAKWSWKGSFKNNPASTDEVLAKDDVTFTRCTNTAKD